MEWSYPLTFPVRRCYSHFYRFERELRGLPEVRIAESSSTTLLVAAAILTVIGAMMLSPEGRLLVLVIGGLAVLSVVFFGPSSLRRVIALVILIAIILQIPSSYRQYRSFRIQKRAHICSNSTRGH
jgi:hypothetical protein